MTDFRKSVAAIGAVRNKFEELLVTQRGHKIGEATATTRFAADRGIVEKLREIEEFGTNPGNLRLLVHVPASLRPSPGIVIALHGCGQTAAEYATGTGWSSLADDHGFIVVYPEQRQGNNPKNCFTWFMAEDIVRGSGEAASIHQMTEHAISRYGADRRRVFVTGLSAGGAMASVMLATHPDTYAGGAIIAGLPYGCAGSVQEAFEAMFSEKSHIARALGENIRKASFHGGPWPTISVWQGSADPIVKPSNADHIIRQWLDVHGLATDPTLTERIGLHSQRIWLDAHGRPAVEAYTLTGMAHAVPLDLAASPGPCGAPGPYFLDVGLSSTLLSARAWGLADVSYSAAQSSAAVSFPESMPASDQAASRAPDGIVAAAMKASGMPLPKIPMPGSTSAPGFDPRAIVEAALRQAGLKR